MRAHRWRSHGRLETRLIAPTLTNASKRPWLDADEQVPAVPLSHRSPGQQPERQRALMLDDSVIIAAADIEQSRFRSLRAARRMSPHDAPHASKCDAQSIPTI